MRPRKNWDAHVGHAELVARTPALRALRDRMLEMVAPAPGDVVADLGSGTGLLSLALAPRVAKVWAIDRSAMMREHLAAKAESAGTANIRPVTASITSLPLVDCSVDAVVSNYCFHELRTDEKLQALGEAFRVLVPGGRLVIADMMFSVGVASARDRRIVAANVSRLLRRGGPGVARLARNAARFATGRWEHPAPARWWDHALREAGFIDVSVRTLLHEGGIASAIRPPRASTAARVSEPARAGAA